MPPLDLEKRVQQAERLDRRARWRSWLLAGGTVASLLAALGCWGAYYMTGVLGYAKLAGDVQIERSPADPEQLVLSYQPVQPGRIAFHLAQADRETDLLNCVSPDQVNRQNTFSWQATETRPGDLVRITGREGMSLATRELTIPERPVVQTAAEGVVSGEIINAVNKKPVPEAKFRILGAPLLARADDQGRFHLEHVPTGLVPMEVTAAGFTSEQFDRQVQAGKPLVVRTVLSPGMKAGQMRIVLTWDKEPKDLDAHLEGPLPGGKQFHVYYHEQGDLHSKEFVHLDVDAQDGEGPETITVLGVLPGTYRYWVHDYTHRDDPNSTALAQSGAEVRLFQGGQTYRFHAGHDMVGNRWNVCTIEVSAQGAVAKKTDTYEGTKLQSLGLYAKRTQGNRQQWITSYGGSALSEKGVDEGLDWLARHQHGDGYWANRCLGGNSADSRCEASDPCTGAGVVCEMAHSGLALLAFQAGGHYYFNQQKYSDVVRRGLDWLVEHQAKDGGLVGTVATASRQGVYYHHYAMYEHGIATFALADACAAAKASGVKPDSRYLDALAKAVALIEQQQHTDGGWRYVESKRDINSFKSTVTDTSVVGWQVLALKSAREAGIDFGPECLAGIRTFFAHRATGSDGRTGYTNRRKLITEATTGVGMLAHQFLLNEPDAPLVQDAADYLAKEAPLRWGTLPRPGDSRDYYLWYNCTLAMFQAGGDNWKHWNDVVRDTILKLQEHTGCARGSWSPDCRWGDTGGRIFSTALAVLTLEVYYRYTQHNELQPAATLVTSPHEEPPAPAPVVALDAARFKLEVKADPKPENKPPAGTAK
jgi:uncharacterized protein YfaP (DUF2135 family)